MFDAFAMAKRGKSFVLAHQDGKDSTYELVSLLVASERQLLDELVDVFSSGG